MNLKWLAPLVMMFSWTDFWWTADQQGQQLMDRGEYQQAAEVFQDPMRQGAAWFRAGEFEKAEQSFARVGTAEAEFNRGNCLVLRGKYADAIARYDRALELKPDFESAQINREIAQIRAERMEQKGGDMGDQKIGADEIRFDKKENQDGQDTELQKEQQVPGEQMQAMWLKRVQTKPADFLRAKFSYQLATEDSEETTSP